MPTCLRCFAAISDSASDAEEPGSSWAAHVQECGAPWSSRPQRLAEAVLAGRFGPAAMLPWDAIQLSLQLNNEELREARAEVNRPRPSEREQVHSLPAIAHQYLYPTAQGLGLSAREWAAAFAVSLAPSRPSEGLLAGLPPLRGLPAQQLDEPVTTDAGGALPQYSIENVRMAVNEITSGPTVFDLNYGSRLQDEMHRQAMDRLRRAGEQAIENAILASAPTYIQVGRVTDPPPCVADPNEAFRYVARIFTTRLPAWMPRPFPNWTSLPSASSHRAVTDLREWFLDEKVSSALFHHRHSDLVVAVIGVARFRFLGYDGRQGLWASIRQESPMRRVREQTGVTIPDEMTGSSCRYPSRCGCSICLLRLASSLIPNRSKVLSEETTKTRYDVLSSEDSED